MINPRNSHQHNSIIPGNQIRTLVLHPARHLNSPLRCSLMQTCLGQKADDGKRSCAYDVLLGWDSEIREHQIICDGRPMYIPQNCQIALKYLRHKSDTRAIWLDAVCVDQLSFMDQTRHSVLLPDIYAQAKNVLVWMGESSASFHKVIRRVAVVGRHLQMLEDHASRHPSSDAAGARKLLTKLYKRFSVTNVPPRWLPRVETLKRMDAIAACSPILISGHASIPLKHFLEWCETQPIKTAPHEQSPNRERSFSSTSNVSLSASTGGFQRTIVSAGKAHDEPVTEGEHDPRLSLQSVPATELVRGRPRKLQKRVSTVHGVPTPRAFSVGTTG